MSYASISHYKHATNLVNQLVSENVICFVKIHRYVSVSMSVSMSVNVDGSKDVKHMNKIDFNILCDGVSFWKK